MGAEIVMEQLYQLNLHNTIRPCGIHTTVLKGVELVGVMAKPLSVIYQSRKDSADWKTDGVIQYTKEA